MRLANATVAVLTALAMLTACGSGGGDEERPAALAVAPAALDFDAVVGQAGPAPATVTVTNSGGGTLAVPSAAVRHLSGAGWLSAVVSGVAAPYTLSVTTSSTGLAAGTYQGAVDLTAPGASATATVPVTLTIGLPPPAIALSPASLAFTAVEGEASPPAREVTIARSGAGTAPLAAPTVSVAYTDGAGWLDAAVSGTSAPYSLTLTPSTAALAPGTYVATVTVAAAGASNAPLAIPVTLTVNAAGMARRVRVSTAGTLWFESGETVPLYGAYTSVTLRQLDAGGVATDVATTEDHEHTFWADLPPGPYWVLAIGPSGRFSYVEVGSGSNDVALGGDVRGISAGALVTLPTQVTFVFAGLSPWVPATDTLRLYDFDAAADWTSALGPAADVAEGATWGMWAPDWNVAAAALAAPSDSIWLTQMRQVSTASATYGRVVAAEELTGITIDDGVARDVSGVELAPPAGTGTLAADVRGAAFSAAVQAAGSSDSFRLWVAAQPAPPRVDTSQWLDLVELSPTVGADVDYGRLEYGRFLPDRYEEFLFVVRMTRVTVANPRGQTRRASNQVARRVPIALADGPIEPGVGCVAGARVNGEDVLAAAVAGAGTTPLLAWDPPLAGSADGYEVEILELVDDPASSTAQVRPVGTVFTTSRSVRLPAGQLEFGRTYCAEITAWKDPLKVGGASPERRSDAHAFSVTSTQPFSP